MTSLSASALLEALPDPAAVLDAEGRIELAHPALARLSPRSDADGGPPAAANHIGLDFFELLRDLSGIRRAAETFARTVPDGDLHDSFVLSRVDPQDGLTERFRLQLHAFRARAGSPVRVLALFRAVVGDDLLEDRLQALELRMTQVREIKHELSNVAMGLVGHAELLLGDVGEDHPLRARVERVRDHGRGVRDLVQAMGDALTATVRRSDAPDERGPDAPRPDDPRRA